MILNKLIVSLLTGCQVIFCGYHCPLIWCVFVCMSVSERKVRVKVAQSCLTVCAPVDCNLPGSSVHGVLQARILEWVAIPFSRGSSHPRNWTQVSRIGGGFFMSEPRGNPKTNVVGSLCLLQQIFPIQESNQGLLHCGQILYQMRC